MGAENPTGNLLSGMEQLKALESAENVLRMNEIEMCKNAKGILDGIKTYIGLYDPKTYALIRTE